MVQVIEKIVQEGNLIPSRRGKVGVPTLGSMRLVASTIVSQVCLPQAGARRDHTNRPAGDRLARVEGAEVGRIVAQAGHGERDRLQIVQQVNGRDAQLVAEQRLIDDPGQVGDGRPAGHYRPGDTKAGPVRLHVGLSEELTDNGLEAAITCAGESCLRQRRARTDLGRDDRQVGFGGADITG